MARLFVIGDVHGMLPELESLVGKLRPEAGDRFAFLGDLVDKGPDSLAVIAYVRRLLRLYPGSVVVCGNHEESALRLKVKADKAGSWDGLKKAEKEPWMLEASDDVWEWLRSLPLIARPLPGVLLVHGGLFPAFFDKHGEVGDLPAAWHKGGGKKMDRARRFLRIRHVDRESGNMVSLGDEGPHSLPWAEWYDGREGFVFYGHAPSRSGEPIRHRYAVGLDTGAVFGGCLSAAVVHEHDAPRETMILLQHSTVWVRGRPLARWLEDADDE